MDLIHEMLKYSACYQHAYTYPVPSANNRHRAWRNDEAEKRRRDTDDDTDDDDDNQEDDDDETKTMTTTLVLGTLPAFGPTLSPH